jgi:hypothetical protein
VDRGFPARRDPTVVTDWRFPAYRDRKVVMVHGLFAPLARTFVVERGFPVRDDPKIIADHGFPIARVRTDLVAVRTAAVDAACEAAARS